MRKLKNWTNKFTEECDKYLTDNYKGYDDYLLNTYLYGNQDGVEFNEHNWCCFRVPGATRGGIKIENGIITDIEFFEDTCFDYSKGIGCFKQEVIEATKKFIGTEFDLPISEFYKGGMP